MSVLMNTIVGHLSCIRSVINDKQMEWVYIDQLDGILPPANGFV